MEWTAGPLTQPYDVCLSIETDLDSGMSFDESTAAQQLLAQLHDPGLPVDALGLNQQHCSQAETPQQIEESPSFGVLPGEEFFTDANSLTMVRRVRGLRSAFAAAPLADEHTANPIGGNYHPMTSAIYLRDAASGRQLSLVTDRGQGAPRRQLQPAISWPDARAAFRHHGCCAAGT